MIFFLATDCSKSRRRGSFTKIWWSFIRRRRWLKFAFSFYCVEISFIAVCMRCSFGAFLLNFSFYTAARFERDFVQFRCAWGRFSGAANLQCEAVEELNLARETTRFVAAKIYWASACISVASWPFCDILSLLLRSKLQILLAETRTAKTLKFDAIHLLRGG